MGKVYGYGSKHAKSGRKADLPPLEPWPNDYANYEIRIEIPEFTSVCPKTGLPDFGTLIITYMPSKLCIELKSLKYYIQGFRGVGIFYENVVNKVLDDVVRTVRPVWAEVRGEFAVRGGMRSVVTARHPRRRTRGPSF